MNNDQVKQLIQNLGMMAELWSITYQSFRSQGLSHADSITHTKAFMSTMMETFINPNGGGSSGQEVK